MKAQLNGVATDLKSFEPVYGPGVIPEPDGAAARPAIPAQPIEPSRERDAGVAPSVDVAGDRASDQRVDKPADLPNAEMRAPAPPAADSAPALPGDAAPPRSPDAPPPPQCLPQRPAAVFDATPAGTCGTVCGTLSALVSDGISAGLDCTGAGSVQIDGHNVTACIGFDFGATQNLDPVVIRASSVARACETACTVNCGTGRTALVFYGRERGLYEFGGEIALLPTLRDYMVTLGLASRYVVVCRTGAGQSRDDVAVDSILSYAPCP